MSLHFLNESPAVVTVAHTAAPLASDHTGVIAVTIQAEFSNVGNIYFGGSNVTVANGLAVPPGDVVEIDSTMWNGTNVDEFFLDEVFINSATAGNGCRVLGARRRNRGSTY